MALTASLLAWGVYTALTAKAPGEASCYKDICHRVYTLDETRRMIGQSVDLTATHYDVPGVDKMNTGELTSSGEAFDATNPARTSASNYPDGTELLLWSPATKRASHVRVNDFGPFWGKRTIDVTRRVADDLGFAKAGVAPLRVIVIWVPPAQAAKYKRYRSYPMSLGSIGVVEADQLEPLARKLILTADQRNRDLMPSPVEPPDFAAEAAIVAAIEAAMLPRRLADMVDNVPKVDMGAQPTDLYRRIYTGPPGLRAEATLDAPQVQAEAEARMVAAVGAAPRRAELAQLPADLLPRPVPAPVPVVVAAVPESAPPPSPPSPVVDLPAPRVATADATAGPISPNRSRVNPQAVAAPENTSPVSVKREPSVAIELPAPASVRSVEPLTRVTVALAQRPYDFVNGSLSLWIGIALMLTTFLGVAGFARRRKGAAAPVAMPNIADAIPRSSSAKSASAMSSTPMSDPLAVARQAAARAEADARELLAHETASRDVTSLAEAQARGDMAREIARRETEREAQMRVKLEVAAEAHASAMRELEEIDAARRARNVPLVVAAARPVARPANDTPAPVREQQINPITAAAKVEAVAPVVLRPEPRVAPPPPAPKPIVVEPPPAVFPGVSDPKLAAAVLGRPGAEKYWGNTIIAGARLDGSARSGSPLRVDGIIDGACYAPVILISEGATVTGVVAAEVIIVLGTVSGTLSGRIVTVAKSAEVNGEIYYQSMSIDPQAQCDVRFRRLAGDADPVGIGTSVFNALMNARTRAA